MQFSPVPEWRTQVEVVFGGGVHTKYPVCPHGWQSVEEQPSGEIFAVKHSAVAFPPVVHPAVRFDAARAWLPMRREIKTSNRAPRAKRHPAMARGALARRGIPHGSSQPLAASM